MEEYQVDGKAALILYESVVEAQRLAVMEMKNKEGSKGKFREGAEADEEDDGEANKDSKLFKKKGNFAHKKGF